MRRVECYAKKIELTVENNRWGEGVVVSQLGAGSAAEEGVVVGDIIIAVNDRAVNGHAAAIDEIQRTVGPISTLSIQGSTREVLLNKNLGKIGITCGNRVDGPGVEVLGVALNGIASAEGILVGDVILSINGSLVNDHSHAIALVDSPDKVIKMVLAVEVCVCGTMCGTTSSDRNRR